MEGLFTIKTVVHYFLHLGFPLIVAMVFYKRDWQRVYLLFLTTMLVDLDHLLATPVFASGRNSIGFHPLHSYFMIGVYVLGCFVLRGNYRVLAIGLVMHMATDFQDYYFWR